MTERQDKGADVKSPDMLRTARDCFGIHADLISDDLMNRLARALQAAYQQGDDDRREKSAKVAFLHDGALIAAAIRGAP